MDRSLIEWLLRGYAVVRLALDEVVAGPEHVRGEAPTLEIVARTRDLEEALDPMAVLTIRATRHLLFQVDRCKVPVAH